MGKCVRIRSSKQPPSPPPAEAAAAYLTLRSGRRVPVLAASAAAAAACSPRTTTSRCGGGQRGPARRCGAESAKRACGGPRRKSAAASPRGRVLVVDGAKLCGRRLEGQLPSQADNLRASDGGCGDDSFEPANTTPLGDGDALVVEVRHTEHESKGVAGRQEMEAEMEAFFAAAELAERRRFAEAYNYDVALDRPLEGRFEWAPVLST